MLADQFKYLGLFYVNPKRAASGVLDHGKFLFGLIAAVLVTIALGIGTDSVKSQEFSREMERIAQATPQITQDDLAGFPATRRLIERRYFATSLKSLFVLAVVFVPVCILILTAWAHLGGGLTILFRDFMPVLAGLLFAWAASQLPIAIFWWTGLGGIPLEIAGIVYFLMLAAAVLSTVMGVSLGQAAGAEIGALAASAGAGLLIVGLGNVPYLFASPLLLYYLYQNTARDMSALSGGLASRQNFKRQLELATINPRDADAHYQLGLIYAQRRAHIQAEQSFRRALEIDPNEPDALFHLGRLLRQQGHDAEARQLLERGAQIDPKLASHQVWRELGAVALATGQPTDALAHLQYYVNVREYDPEGLVLYGRALRSLSRPDEARAAFQKAIEAVRTAPQFRRGELVTWEKQARQELKA